MSAQYLNALKIVDAVIDDRRDLLRRLFRVLDTGLPVGEVASGAYRKLADDVSPQLRKLRDDLIELDLYRFHFGPLPQEFNDR